MEDNTNGIKDISSKQINDSDNGEIKFRVNKKKSKGKFLFKGIIFVLVAAISGGITSVYVIDSKLDNSRVYRENNQSLLQSNQTVINEDLPKNSVTRVAEIVGPAVVGISNNIDGIYKRDIKNSTGSGVIFDDKGYIVTNFHVIEGADSIKVKLSSGKVLDAKVVGVDKMSDLAVIKIEAQKLPIAKFADSSKVRVGDLAVAIGNPLGEQFEGTVTAGIISAVNRTIKISDPNTNEPRVYKVMQTDAAINPGNSGGPLCNAMGEIIGINSLKISNQYSEYNVEGMGFAITSNEAKSIVDSLMSSGKVIHPVIGILGGTAESDKKNSVKGVYVKEVKSGTGAAAAGVKPTDIIVEVNGKKIETMEQLMDIVNSHKVGETLSCKIWRNGKILDVSVILSEKKQ